MVMYPIAHKILFCTLNFQKRLPHDILHIRWVSEGCAFSFSFRSNGILGRNVGSCTSRFQKKSIAIIPEEHSLNGIKDHFQELCMYVLREQCFDPEISARLVCQFSLKYRKAEIVPLSFTLPKYLPYLFY